MLVTEQNPFVAYLYLPALPSEEGYHFHPNLERFGTLDEPLLHTHDYDEICLIRSGKITVISEDVHVVTDEPCLLLYKKGCAHAQFNDRNRAYEKYMISLGEALPLALQSLSHRICRGTEASVVLVPLTEKQVDWLFHISEHLNEILSDGGDVSSESAVNCFTYLLSEILVLLKNRPQTNSSDSGEILTRAMEYISQHLSENLSLNVIASQVGVGRTKLNEAFQNTLSISVYQYILRERMVFAQRCLERGDSVREVADACGFNDSAHFIRTFKRYFTVTPGQYRKGR